MPRWDELRFTWGELKILPSKWKAALSQWRGIYFIFDESDGQGYVGAAYGKENILGRWLNYAKRGHGGNKERGGTAIDDLRGGDRPRRPGLRHGAVAVERHLRMGKDAKTATIDGIAEVRLAVLSSTLMIVLVAVPSA